jgi:hypothetical protein
MMKRLVLAGVTVATVLGVAMSANAQSGDGQCVRTQFLRNHTVGDNHTLYFDYDGRDVVKLTTSGNCLAAVTSSDPIVLKDRSAGQICKPIDWDIRVRGIPCMVTGMTKLTPAEVAALPKGKRP